MKRNKKRKMKSLNRWKNLKLITKINQIKRKLHPPQLMTKTRMTLPWNTK
jgi:hypothetical protein